MDIEVLVQEKKKRFFFKTMSFFVLALALSAGAFLWEGRAKEGKILSDKKSLKSPINSKENFLTANFFLTPHHLVAKREIEKIFQTASELNQKGKIKEVLIISPNHFNLGGAAAIVSDRDWAFDGKKVASNKLLAENLSRRKNIYLENEAFHREHGVLDLVPFVEKYFPGAEMNALMLKEGISAGKLEEIKEDLLANLGSETLVILSSDFSHLLDRNFSSFHDQKAIEVIENFSWNEVLGLETDCVGGLWILMKLAEARGFGNFQLIANTNSSKIYGENFVGENTSYVAGYFESNKKALQGKQKSAHLLFAGDLMLDRENRKILLGRGASYPAADIQRLFWSQDWNIANLEGTITDNSSVSVDTTPEQKGHFLFSFEPISSLAFLKENRINLVGLANNHSLNFGENGLEQTRNYLKKEGIEYFGDPLKKENHYISRQLQNQRIVIVGLNMFGHPDKKEALELVKSLNEKNDWVIVYPHWGTEYDLVFNSLQQSIARELIDAGADLIIGAHPHVVQPVEIYKNRAIFYSLGNFWFDQYFSEETMNGLAVGVSLDKEAAGFYLMPLVNNRKGQLSLAENDARNDLLERLAQDSLVDDNIKNGIRDGQFFLSIDRK